MSSPLAEDEGGDASSRQDDVVSPGDIDVSQQPEEPAAAAPTQPAEPMTGDDQQQQPPVEPVTEQPAAAAAAPVTPAKQTARAMPQSAPPTPAQPQHGQPPQQHQRQLSGPQQPIPPRSSTQPPSPQSMPQPQRTGPVPSYTPAVTLSSPIGSGTAPSAGGDSSFWDSMFSSGQLAKCSPEVLEWCPDLADLAPPQTTLGADWIRLQQNLIESDRATGHVPPYTLRFGYVDELGDYHSQLEWATSADVSGAGVATTGGSGRSKRESKHTARAREAAKEILSSIQHHRVTANRAVALPPRKDSAPAGNGLPPLAPGTSQQQQQLQAQAAAAAASPASAATAAAHGAQHSGASTPVASAGSQSASGSGNPSPQLNPATPGQVPNGPPGGAPDSQQGWLLNSEDGI